VNRGLSEEALASARASLTAALREHGAREPDALAEEGAVVLDALAAAAAPAASEVDRGEALALAALLGRRLAIVGAGAGLALVLVDTLEQERQLSAVCDRRWGSACLRLAILDGFASGLREAVEAELEARLADRVEALPLGAGLVLALLPPLADEGRASAAADGIGRALLRLDAKACVLWARARAPGVDDVTLRAALQLGEHARMVGAKFAIATPDAELRAALAGRLDATVPLLGALPPALDALGYATKESGALWRWLG
jgi:hypothetical protein